MNSINFNRRIKMLLYLKVQTSKSTEILFIKRNIKSDIMNFGEIMKITDIFDGVSLPDNNIAKLSDLPGLGITLNEKNYNKAIISI